MTEPNRQSGENEERIIEIEIERLRPFKEHPFQVKDDKEMFLLQESIEKYGILNPLIVRPVPDGYYEIISGHRRKHAAEKLGYRKVPVIIRVLSEDDSILTLGFSAITKYMMYYLLHITKRREHVLQPPPLKKFIYFSFSSKSSSSDSSSSGTSSSPPVSKPSG